MSKSKHNQQPKGERTKLVDFSCCTPNATAVFVAGTFNNWNPDATPLTRDNAGNWRASLKLPADATSSSSWWMVGGVVIRGAKATMLVRTTCPTNSAA